MDQPDRMNLTRIDVKLRCTAEQAESLVGEADHVAYGADTGIAEVHRTEASPAPVTEAIDKASDEISGLLGSAGLGNDDLLDVRIETEALISDGGTWRRRGDVVPMSEGWGETLTGEPMPNVAAAVRRSRESH